MTEASAIHEKTSGDQEFIEGIRIRLQPAPMAKRIMAFCIDLAILTAVQYGLFIVAIFVGAFLGLTAGLAISQFNFGTFARSGLSIAALLYFLLFLLLALALMQIYFIYFEYKTGATPGKKLFGLKVVSVDGKRMSRGQVIYRDMARWYLDLLFLLPGLISIAFTEKGQRVGDLLAKTMVVYSEQREKEQNYLYVPMQDYQLLYSYLKPAGIPSDFMSQYLAFAYPEILVKQGRARAEEFSNWEMQIRHFLPNSTGLNLNQETVLRFFAEYSMQELNLRKRAGG